MNRPCLDCGAPTATGSRCPACQPTTTQRGYGAKHQKDRRRWAIRIAHEPVFCARCHLLIHPDDNWVDDHDDDDRTVYLGPSHVDCNAKAGTAKRERLRRGA
jgi:hypothetical protein